jgi:coniferyl-aldehyde dehydrogenase
MTDTAALRATLDRLRRAHVAAPMPDWATRKRRLGALEALLRENVDAIATAISADFGHRATEETSLLEVFPSLGAIAHALRHGRRWMRARTRFASLWFLPARATLLPQPLGVVGIIVPWNYPLYLAVGPMVDALVAGNRVMVKMSELTPVFSALFERLVGQYLGPDAVVVVNGDAAVARRFSALPFDHLLFTGSTAVGRDVMRAAAEHLVPVTLELGGKSPAIIGPGARLDHAVERIVFGKLVNAGQTCIAPDYVLLPRTQVDAFIAAARARSARFFPAIADNAQYTSVASTRHYERLAALRDEAIEAGATAHVLGNPGQGGRRMPPTLLTGVADGMRVMQEEIFGPLLPLLAYEHIDEAIAYVQSHPQPLALYLFEENKAVVDDVLARTSAGGVTINDTLFHIAQHALPFGGVGPSGMGAYHGEAGFRTFSRMKPVLRQARFNGVGLLNPPYGRRFAAMLKLMLRP